MEGIGKAFGCMLTAIVVMFLVLVVIAILWLTDDGSIRSDKPINPEIELTTDGKVIDTVYVYKEP